MSEQLTKIGQLEFADFTDQQILRLEITEMEESNIKGMDGKRGREECADKKRGKKGKGGKGTTLERKRVRKRVDRCRGRSYLGKNGEKCNEIYAGKGWREGRDWEREE